MSIDQHFKYHAISGQETADKLSSDREEGLSKEEVEKRRKKFGENKLPEKGRRTALKIFIKQFKDFLILILAIAAGISWYIGEMADVYIIAGVILFNAIMGFVQEYRAEKAIESIKDMVQHMTTVIRGGTEHRVKATEVVPGDLITITEGEAVPADAKIIRAKNLKTVEASLTGESVPSDKEPGENPEEAPLADRSSMVFKGTQVARGRGTAIVTATGVETEIGSIASSLTEMDKTSSAFRDKTDRLAKIMAALAVSTALIVFAVGYWGRGFEFDKILLVTIATMVSSIPEGLPVVISIVLAIGARRMAKRNAIIREFTATEMLGSVTTILTDKTGTITESILTVKKMFINKDLETEVSGLGYELKGEITENGENLRLGEDSRFDKMALIAAYCNNARVKEAEIEEEEEEEEEGEEGKVKKDKRVKKDKKVVEDSEKKEIKKKEEYRDEHVEDGKKVIEEHYEETHKKILKRGGEVEKKKKEAKKEKKAEKNSEQEERNAAKSDKEEVKPEESKSLHEAEELPDDPENIEVSGDPTEAALLVMSVKAGIQLKEAYSNLKIIDDLPFNSEAKFRGSLVEYPDGDREIFVVGAPEKILDLSAEIITGKESEKLGEDSVKKIREKIDSYTEDAMRVVALAYKKVSKEKDTVVADDIEDLVWAGITGIVDPPREGVADAIRAARDAGIRVVMVTGDHKKTARAIAHQVGIIEEGENALSAEEIEEDREAFGKQVKNTNVFARVDPDTKLRIAEYLQDEGELVGMTGDGVNDAPALKRADVGIAMGQRGTDVAKDSSAIVLSDDNFSTIVNAIEEGRIVFKNVRNTTFFLITTNFASTMTIVACIALGLPLPLLAAQILFVNLVTDGIMDVALATEPGHGDVMKQKPYGRHEHILNRKVIPYIIIVGGAMITLAVLVFNYYLPQGTEVARTGAFLVVAMTQLFNAFNMRSPDRSIFNIGLSTNRWVLLAFGVSLILQLVVLKVPFFMELFTFGDIPWLHIAIIFLLSSSVLILGEVFKLIKNKFNWDI